MVTKKTPKVVLTAVAIVIAAYILSPFYLVLINTFKNANGIVANPVSFAGASFAQFKTNISNVVNNSNFSFWSAFGTSAVSYTHLLLLCWMPMEISCHMAEWQTVMRTHMQYRTEMFPQYISIFAITMSIWTS